MKELNKNHEMQAGFNIWI